MYGAKRPPSKRHPPHYDGCHENRAEVSTNKLKSVHTEKAEKLQQDMQNIKSTLPLAEKLKTNFNASTLHEGKILATAKEMNFQYPDVPHPMWTTPLSFQLRSGDRFYIEGNNGSGKTTLLKLICGELVAVNGTLDRIDFSTVYLDQEYSLIHNEYSILEQADHFNRRHLPEHELKTILNRYLFQ